MMKLLFQPSTGHNSLTEVLNEGNSFIFSNICDSHSNLAVVPIILIIMNSEYGSSQQVFQKLRNSINI